MHQWKSTLILSLAALANINYTQMSPLLLMLEFTPKQKCSSVVCSGPHCLLYASFIEFGAFREDINRSFKNSRKTKLALFCQLLIKIIWGVKSQLVPPAGNHQLCQGCNEPKCASGHSDQLCIAEHKPVWD